MGRHTGLKRDTPDVSSVTSSHETYMASQIPLTMRRLLLTAAVSILVMSAGCSSVLSGQTTEFDASPASVNEDTAESIGYQGGNTTTQTIQRNVSVGGQNRTIKITNHITQYKRSGTQSQGEINITVPEVSRFIIISTPGAEVAGQTLNPAANWDNRRIVDEVSKRTNAIEDLEYVGNRTTESLESSREVSVFNGTTQMSGQDIDVRAHLTSFEHDGDVLIAVGAHSVRVDEEENIDEMIGGIEHGAEDSDE
jgi:hypothetical protein